MGRSDMMDANPLRLLVNQAEQPIVGADKIVSFRYNDDRSSSTSDTRVDNSNVYCAFWKVTISRLQDIPCLPDILRCDLVGDVDDLNLRIDLENDTLHTSSKGIASTEIGCQRYERRHQSLDRID